VLEVLEVLKVLLEVLEVLEVLEGDVFCGMPSRRQFLIAGGAALASAAAVGVYTWQIEPHWVELVRRPMPLPDLPTSLVGRTVLQLSDLHVGPRVDSGYLIETLQEASRLTPDVVLLTGDFITYRSPARFDELARVVAHAPRGRLATVAALGNHDFGIAWRQLDVADHVTDVLRGIGMMVLRNDVADVEGLQIVGLGDYWTPDFGPARPVRTLLSAPPHAAGAPELRDAVNTLDRLDRAKPTIVLCHNPDALDEPIWGDLRGWVLAGHTHGGQCKPPFLPPPVLPVRNRRYTSGVFSVAPGRTLYINRGLGHLIQVRFNARPEVTLFTLERGD
jgi:predicted MPP superfamily phosphohydrolase